MSQYGLDVEYGMVYLEDDLSHAVTSSSTQSTSLVVTARCAYHSSAQPVSIVLAIMYNTRGVFGRTRLILTYVDFENRHMLIKFESRFNVFFRHCHDPVTHIIQSECL